MIPEHDNMANHLEWTEAHGAWGVFTDVTSKYWSGMLKKFSEPSKIEKIFSGNPSNRPIKFRRYGTYTNTVEDEKNSHMADALMYGHTAQRIWYDETKKEIQEEATDWENPDGTPDGVAQGQIKIQQEEKA
jgi:hypothetical protein